MVVHPDLSVRDALAELFRSVALPVCGFEDVSELLDALYHGRIAAPGVVVAHLAEGGEDADGSTLQRALLARQARMPIIFVAEQGEVAAAVRAMRAGAFDYLESPVGEEVLLGRVMKAMTQSRQEVARAGDLAQLRTHEASLSRRERQVMSLVVRGKLNKQVAAELNVSSKTVEIHRGHVMKKMHAGSLSALVRMAVDLETRALIVAEAVDGKRSLAIDVGFAGVGGHAATCRAMDESSVSRS